LYVTLECLKFKHVFLIHLKFQQVPTDVVFNNYFSITIVQLS
jgi:hypothetical protein